MRTNPLFFWSPSLRNRITVPARPRVAAHVNVISFIKESDMKILRTVMTSVLVTGFLLCFMTTAYSQGTNLGTIRGTVTDPNGAVIPNAAVQVTDKATGISRDVTTDSDGNYEVAALKPGIYKISVTATGFKTTEMDAVLKGSDVVRAD